MTCEDCIHHELCVCVGTRKLYPGSSEGCRFFAYKNRFVELPCKLGDPVYIIGGKYRAGRQERWINAGKFRLSDLEKMGKTVFLTREEAEAAIVGRMLNERTKACLLQLWK